MPNLLTGTINPSAPTNAIAGVSSAQLVASNNNRVGLVLVNVSSSTVYLGLNNATATINAGIVLGPNGGVWVMGEYTYNNGTINAIGHAAGNVVCVQEFVR